MQKTTILDRALAGERLVFTDPEFAIVEQKVVHTARLLQMFNQTTQTGAERRQLLSDIFGTTVPISTDIKAPLHSDFGGHIFVGENVFINQDVILTDLGGIYLGDGVLIGPRSTLITVNHVEAPKHRRDLLPQAIHIEAGAWLGAGVTVLPGVTIGENTIIGAGAVVTKDIPANVVAVGTPAKILRHVLAEVDDESAI
ncbi:acetyltransferase [Lactobacillus sp. CBA3606]|uniref:sugar O-acetyltransferase n=1 Tax=Lactobacillus sp. CBA3606 TaxID=2099789 RepID=UPI000CFDC434|nr:sugar O-acetyltransferase [Lactobacillus sp. CBA3606]AVK64186.1 acetyltransferase [Lactobacillus sp. CBA3606]